MERLVEGKPGSSSDGTLDPQGLGAQEGVECQRRLADPRLADEGDDPRSALGQLLDETVQGRLLAIAADETGPSVGFRPPERVGPGGSTDHSASMAESAGTDGKIIAERGEPL